MEKEQYPMRINKYLAMKGYSTRRGADELIEKKQVFINGKLAILGDKVLAEDVVEVKHKTKPQAYLYFAYNKPAGVVSHSPQHGEQDVIKASALKNVFPVGRLDKDSHGLMILTNDGRITDRMLNPEHDHEKEYIVKTVQKHRTNFKEKMENGVDIGDYVTQPCKVFIIDEHKFAIVISEGKKHQIKRMVVANFNEVRDLQRVRIMNINLGKLAPNSYRKIEGKELSTFLKNMGL
jgi:23S rRNA pseudouridine2604 synthase